MPDELAELRDRMLTAQGNLAMAEDARDQASADLSDAQAKSAAAFEAAEEAREAESTARTAYINSLKAHGWHDTASGPAADQPTLAAVCNCGHTVNLHNVGGRWPGGLGCTAAGCACTAWNPTAAAQAAAAELGRALGLRP